MIPIRHSKLCDPNRQSKFFPGVVDEIEKRGRFGGGVPMKANEINSGGAGHKLFEPRSTGGGIACRGGASKKEWRCRHFRP